MKVIIIGGVAAGMSTATKLKRNLGDQVDLVVYEKGEEVSFGACGIPFYISDKIKKGEDLIARTAEQFAASGIPVKINHEVLSVDEKAKVVTVKDLTTGETFTDSYDKLVIGSGAGVNRFVPFDNPYSNLYEIRNVADGIHVKEQLQKEDVKDIVVVGAGFIGLELVEACRKYNKNVVLVELADRVLSTMDEEITVALTEELERNQVQVLTGYKAEALSAKDDVIESVVVTNGTDHLTLTADMIINCAGIRPHTAFIECVEKAANGAIIVNEDMETSVADIYAAGDCSIMKSAITGAFLYAPLGTNANKQGRIIADLLGGKERKPFKLIGSSAIKLFDIDAAKVGISEVEAKRLGLNYKTNFITGNSYASYYGTEKVSIKLVYDAETRKILGAQTVGSGVVVPRANYYAIAIYSGLTVDEFGFMDLCYSPPFSGVWDVALIASNTAK
ncbi:CoA-disulfide reductase [Niameybacter massiliensis]|uniref:CoA-disulfide reductase n=1 Tax=Holtiella tumoricola TaxID=3018743 RepID=A0AA42IZS5_9FIRM|nr:CoA-disulfide reductase [Holtiella tumoricola]MDA3730742.1 CoA-disulfide reductase [Holtiella tumoricola]